MLTTAYVKEYLPDVSVQYQNEIFVGKLSGRKNKFATVTIAPNGDYGYGYVTAEVSWDAVVRMINTGVPLVF